MPYGSNCEICGKEPPLITTGPFAGSRGGFDYCEFCSKDLCEDCMKKKCKDSPTGFHQAPKEE